MGNCIFCSIINGEIPSKIVYRDEDMIIIPDIMPQATKHYLLIPTQHFANIIDMTDAQSLVLAKCIKKLSTLVDSLGLENGFRLVSNKGADAKQSVEHLHIHILGGESLNAKMG